MLQWLENLNFLATHFSHIAFGRSYCMLQAAIRCHKHLQLHAKAQQSKLIWWLFKHVIFFLCYINLTVTVKGGKALIVPDLMYLCSWAILRFLLHIAGWVQEFLCFLRAPNYCLKWRYSIPGSDALSFHLLEQYFCFWWLKVSVSTHYCLNTVITSYTITTSHAIWLCDMCENVKINIIRISLYLLHYLYKFIFFFCKKLFIWETIYK